MRKSKFSKAKKLEILAKWDEKMYANLSMDHEILQEGYEMVKKYAAQDAKKK